MSEPATSETTTAAQSGVDVAGFASRGTLVRRRAVLAAGTILTRGTPVYDIVRGEVLRASADQPLVIPEGAVVVPGSRELKRGAGQGAETAWGLSLYTPVIVKYRDDKTDLSSTLEDLLR